MGYLAILNAACSAPRVSEQSQVGYQGPGEPENIQREEQSERIISVPGWRFPKTLLFGKTRSKFMCAEVIKPMD